MPAEYQRSDPDVRPALVEAAGTPRRGHLRIYLGAAPGVGKTFAMLQEGRRRKDGGTDVVIGFVETHGRPGTANQIGDLELVPPREIPYRGVVLREMDTDAVIARHPQVVLVDELAHTNVPGSTHEKRFEDVMELLDGGMSVISTLDVQHLESLNDYVEKVTGVAVHERVPDWVFDQAEQVELLDMTPEALIERMTHGDIYPPEQTRRALENFFTIGNLTVLRDLALRSTAAKVENNLDRYMRSPQIEAVAIGERVMVGVHHRPIGKALIRRGYRIAAAMKGELIVVYVEPTERRRQVQSVQEERQLRTNLELVDELGAKVVRLRGKVSDELIAHARANHASQLIIGSSMHGRRGQLLRGSVTSDILRKMPDIDIHVIGNRIEPR